MPPGQALARRGRPRRADPEDRERHLARLPGRPDVDRRRRRDPGARARCSSSRRCSRAACSSWTSSSRWARGSSSATRTARSSPARRRSYGQRLESPDIRAGMAMLIAALCAEGTSTIGNIRQIDRGYERIDERLRALGADDRARASCERRARLAPRRAARRTSPPASPVLDHLLDGARARRTASTSRSRSSPTSRRPRSTRPGVALGQALWRRSSGRGAHGSGVDALGDEALAMVVVEASGQPARRVERRPHRRRRSSAPISRHGSSARSPTRPALTLHVRLIEGENTDHVLEAIFKALGVALAERRSTDLARGAPMEKIVDPHREGTRPRSRARRTTRRSASATSCSSPASSASSPARRPSRATSPRRPSRSLRNLAADPRGGRQLARQPRQDDRLPPGSRRLRGDERGVRPARRRAPTGPLDVPGREASRRRPRRDRGDRAPSRRARRRCRPRSAPTSARSASTPTSSAGPSATSCSGFPTRTRTSSCPASTRPG